MLIRSCVYNGNASYRPIDVVICPCHRTVDFQEYSLLLSLFKQQLKVVLDFIARMLSNSNFSLFAQLCELCCTDFISRGEVHTYCELESKKGNVWVVKGGALFLSPATEQRQGIVNTFHVSVHEVSMII